MRTKMFIYLLIINLLLTGCIHQQQPTIVPSAKPTSIPVEILNPTQNSMPSAGQIPQVGSTPTRIGMLSSTQTEKNSSGRIIFRAMIKISPDQFQTMYFIMDSDGGHVVALKEQGFTGAPGWSRDGKYIALGCEDPYFCIVDTAFLYNDFVYPQKMGGDVEHSFNMAYGARLVTLPKECLQIPQDERDLRFSWSPEGKQLALTCISKAGIALQRF